MEHTAIRIIKDEHLTIGAILHCLTHMTMSIRERGIRPDYEILRGMLYYLDVFPERFHHPKEDKYLFAKLSMRTSQSREVIKGLMDEHARGEERIRHLMQAAIRLEWGGYRYLQNFTEQLENYSEFYWRHMRVEEDLILPLAERVLTDADWQAIDSAFSTNADPMMGVDAKRKFDELFSRIVEMAPMIGFRMESSALANG